MCQHEEKQNNNYESIKINDNNIYTISHTQNNNYNDNNDTNVEDGDW